MSVEERLAPSFGVEKRTVVCTPSSGTKIARSEAFRSIRDGARRNRFGGYDLV